LIDQPLFSARSYHHHLRRRAEDVKGCIMYKIFYVNFWVIIL